MLVDFPDDRTSARLDLERSQVYEPGTEPTEPGVADGEVARVVTTADLPEGREWRARLQLLQRNERKAAFKASVLPSSRSRSAARSWQLPGGSPAPARQAGAPPRGAIPPSTSKPAPKSCRPSLLRHFFKSKVVF